MRIDWGRCERAGAGRKIGGEGVAGGRPTSSVPEVVREAERQWVLRGVFDALFTCHFGTCIGTGRRHGYPWPRELFVVGAQKSLPSRTNWSIGEGIQVM